MEDGTQGLDFRMSTTVFVEERNSHHEINFLVGEQFQTNAADYVNTNHGKGRLYMGIIKLNFSR